MFGLRVFGIARPFLTRSLLLKAGHDSTPARPTDGKVTATPVPHGAGRCTSMARNRSSYGANAELPVGGTAASDFKTAAFDRSATLRRSKTEDLPVFAAAASRPLAAILAATGAQPEPESFVVIKPTAITSCGG